MKTAHLFFTTHKIFLATLLCTVFFSLLPHTVVFALSAGTLDDIASTQTVAGKGVLDKVGDWVSEIIYTMSLAIGGGVMAIGGVFLDLSIDQTVLKMGTFLKDSNTASLGGQVKALWAVVRDILNIFFIFGLIYIGIKTILNSEDSETRRTLGLLIVAAFVINFSLYITQVIIDFSNIAATQVYNQIVSNTLTDTSVSVGGGPATGANSIFGSLWTLVGGNTFFGGDNAVVAEMTLSAAFFYSIMMLVFLIVAGIVFAMGAVLLIVRFISLIIYMILSPLMFAGWVFPAFMHAQEKWRKGFLSQAFFAPAFLFMLYLSFVVLQALKTSIVGTSAGFSNMAVSGVDATATFGHLLFFAMMIGFLYASVKVGSMMGIAGASAAQAMTGKVIGGLTMGMAARTGRATVGNIGQRIADSKFLKDNVRRRGLSGMLVRGTLSGAGRVGDSSFDARQTGMTKNSQIDLGQGKKGGLKTRQTEAEKKEKQIAESYGEIDDDDTRVKELTDHEHHLEDELTKLKRQREDASKEDKESFDVLIKEKQAEIKEQKEDITREKNRRQIGAYADPAFAAGTKEAYAVADEIRKDSAKKLTDQVKIVENAKKSLDSKVKSANTTLATATDEANAIAASEIEKEELLIADERVHEDEKYAARKRINEAKETARVNIAAAKGIANEEVKEVEISSNKIVEEARKEMKQIAKTHKEQNKKIKELKKQAQKEAADQGYAGVLEKSGIISSGFTGRLRSQNRAAGKAVRKQFTKGRLKEEAHAHEDKGHDDHSAADHAPAPAGAAAPAGAHH